jgi:integrase
MATEFINVPGQGRIYKRGKVWYLDYWVDDKRIRERASCNKRDALKQLGEKATDAGRGTLVSVKKKIVHFSDFAGQYLKIIVDRPDPVRNIRTVRGHIEHLKDFLGERPLSRITPELVEAYQKLRIEEKVIIKRKREAKEEKRARMMKGTTINRELATLRNLFNIARKKKLFQGINPVADVTFYPETRRQNKILSLEEYARLIKAADPRLRPIIQVAVRTGLRKNDILSLKRKNIDFNRMLLTAWVSKTQEWQTFRMGEDLAAILKAIPGTGEYIFTNPKTGTKWNDIKKWWESAKKKAGLDAPGLLIFHDLRANAGIRVEEVAGRFAAQTLLNHKSQKTTEMYLHLTPERDQAAAKALADFFQMEPEEGGTNVAQTPVPINANVSALTH